MFEVRSLELARAWLLSARALVDEGANAEAARVLEQVASDPNDIAAPYRADIAALRRRLEA